MFEKHHLLKKLGEKDISPSVIEAFSVVDREDFIPHDLEKMAYDDIPLPIGKGQTISQPSTIGVMLSLLNVKKGPYPARLNGAAEFTTAAP